MMNNETLQTVKAALHQLALTSPDLREAAQASTALWLITRKPDEADRLFSIADEPATEKQISYLRLLGDSMTPASKRQASHAIHARLPRGRRTSDNAAD